jgi:phospholipid transport system substrate-binding protein
MKLQLQKSVLIVALLFSSLVLAVSNDPIVMMKSVTTNVLNALKQNHINKDSTSAKLDLVINKYILPYVDFNEMSTWVAGRKAWTSASQGTRDEFVRQFKTLVVRTYATALNSYSNEVVEFVPQNIDTSKKRIQIASYIKRPNKEKIRVDYRLIQHGNSWLVYDVIIEGVSILQGFQAQFSDKIRNQGLAPVIKEIKDHNAQKTTKVSLNAISFDN